MFRATPWVSLAAFAVSCACNAFTQADDLPVVPGTGTLIDFVGDRFEESNWDFVHNHPKSSREQDEQARFPRGFSTNGRWFEGPERGQPDLMKVVPTPKGALPGSKQALLVRTMHSGIPGFTNNKVEQDDLIVDCVTRLGGPIPVAEVPSVVVRVYLPPADQWEDRTGPHFGFRGTTNCMIWKSEDQKVGRFRSRTRNYQTRDPYWPGMWIHFRSQTDSNIQEDAAYLAVRGNKMGHDFKVRDISANEFGWWTLGLSFTGSGMIHYYARPGVEDLTADDFLTSQYPYSRQAERFETMFFNFCNQNDGRTWSTPFLIDDPQLYIIRSARVMNIVNNKKQMAARKPAMQAQTQQQRPDQENAARRREEQRTAKLVPTLRTNRKRTPPEPPTIRMR